MTGEAQSDPYLPLRMAMVDEQLRRRGIRDADVLTAMERVPRQEFIPHESWHEAYRDRPVPIGEGQTISQPYIVAAMIEVLQVQPTSTVLEVGTGTGYEAAILGELASQVYTVERHATLAATAQQVLRQLGYRNIEIVVGDGSLGLPERAPFDRIIVAAGSPDIPSVLLQQLEDGGRMVIPVGPPDVQVLKLIRRVGSDFISSNLDACRFVPLVGKHGFPDQNL